MQPCGIIINILIHVLFGESIQFFVIGQQNTCVAGNGGQRGAKIVGNGAQKGRPEFFMLCLQLRLFFLSGISAVLKGHGAITKNGKQHAVLKGFQRFVSFDDHSAVNSILNLDGILQNALSAAGGDPGKNGDMAAQQF